VSATRQATQLFVTPFSMAVLKAPSADMPMARTTPEALQQVAGVFVQKTNHGGGSPFLRGLTGNQTLVMVDGIRFNNAAFRFGPNQYTNLIDAFTIDRIEVVKGSGSVQYGSDAMGGVVQILTKDRAFTNQGQFFGEALGRLTTQNMEYTTRAELGYACKKLVVMGGYTFRQFGDLYGGDTTGRQHPSGYRESNWNLKLKAQVGADAVLTVSSQQVVQSGVPLYHRVKLENFAYYNFDPQKMNLSYARLNINGRHPLIDQIELTGVFKRSSETRRYQRNGSLNYFVEKDLVDTWGATAEVKSVCKNWWTANTGVEWYHDAVSSQRVRANGTNQFNERGLYPHGAAQSNFSVFTLHHLKVKKLHGEIGLRFNRFSNQIPAETIQLPGQPKPQPTNTNPSAVVANAGLLWQFRKQHAVYASFSNGYRAPGIDDMGTLGLVDFRYEVPAYNLNPERNFNTEIGYRLHTDAVQLGATAFYMHLTQLISRVRRGTDSLQGFPVFIKVNDQQAYVKGVELSGQWNVGPALQLKSFAAYQFGQNLSRNEAMRRIPPFNGLTTLRLSKKMWYLAADHQWAAKQNRLAQGDKDDNRIPKGGTPGWQVVNLYGGVALAQWHLQLSAVNILNQDYRTHGSGINGMGRAGVVQIRFSFK
jgi:hemoglobin/transferrin/lactoferrin receptor protein